jgi:hypothetical protein
MPAQAGTINVLSDNRSVDTRATAGSLNGSVTQPDAKTAAPFQTFAELASSSVAWPDPVNPIFSNNASAAARQTSSLLAKRIQSNLDTRCLRDWVRSANSEIASQGDGYFPS